MLLAGFWPFFLVPLSDSPSAEVTRRSWRLLSGFPFIFHAKYTDAALGHGFGVPVVCNDGVARRFGVWTFPRAVCLHLEIWYFLQSTGFFGR